MPLAADNPVTVEGAALGRYLFYDAVLSGDRSMSCASCHQQQHAFSDPLAFSKTRTSVTNRNTMALFNLAWYPAFFWDGRASSIEDQVFHPLRNKEELSLDWQQAAERVNANDFYRKKFRDAFGPKKIDSVLISKAIGQFLRTLISHESKYDRVIAGKDNFTKDEFDGFVIANEQNKGDCLHCHATDAHALGTFAFFSNNGLDLAEDGNFKDPGRGGVTGDKKDNGKFMVPTLRNLLFTSPYMHDGRFKTLEEVVEFYSSGIKKSSTIDKQMEWAHQGGNRLTAEQKAKLLSFLKTLSDSVFIRNPEFSNPFRPGR